VPGKASKTDARREKAMAMEVRVKTVVLPGGKIEMSNPGLIPGQEATVVVLVEEQQTAKKLHVIDILSGLSGHRLSQNAQEVDEYLRGERES
jgi:hypothetical protein